MKPKNNKSKASLVINGYEGEVNLLPETDGVPPVVGLNPTTSNHCKRCNRSLKKESSQKRGYGIVCARKEGIVINRIEKNILLNNF